MSMILSGSPLGELSYGHFYGLKQNQIKKDLFGIVRNENNGEAYRLTYETDLPLGSQTKQTMEIVKSGKRKVEPFISYAQATTLPSI